MRWLLVGLLLLQASAVTAQSARELFVEGEAALRRGRFVEAADRLERSLEAQPRLGTAYNLALAYRGMGRAIDAEALLGRILEGELGRLDARRRRQVEQNLVEVRDSIGTLRIHVTSPPVVEVRLDGTRLEAGDGGLFTTRLDPGPHTLVVQAVDHRPVEQSIEGTGDTEDLTLRLRPARDDRPGTLILRSADEDTRFRVQGGPTGASPLRARLAPGRYEVEVEGPHGVSRTQVEVPAGRRIALTLEPPRGSVLRRPWFWVVAGVVLAGVVVGSVLIANIEREAPALESQVFPTIYALELGP